MDISAQDWLNLKLPERDYTIIKDYNHEVPSDFYRNAMFILYANHGPNLSYTSPLQWSVGLCE